MALWTRVSGQSETWPEMEDAARERFWDGVTLACGEERETGAVYLWGYVAEILLKCACLRVRRLRASDDVGPVLKSQGIKHHELSDLMQDLRVVRAAASRPLSPVLERTLRARVDTIIKNWNVLLRYRSARATETELNEVFGAVDWLIGTYSMLV